MKKYALLLLIPLFLACEKEPAPEPIEPELSTEQKLTRKWVSHKVTFQGEPFDNAEYNAEFKDDHSFESLMTFTMPIGPDLPHKMILDGQWSLSEDESMITITNETGVPANWEIVKLTDSGLWINWEVDSTSTIYAEFEGAQ